MQAQLTNTGRQFGLDWLRIGAFGILIFYHIGMFFVPWGWHVKTAVPIEWVQWPMMAVNPWRLSLLFVISGVVSRALLGKLANPGAFAASRSWRLLIPLIAGMALFVAPQPWAELRDQGRIETGFLSFWLGDYFEFGDSLGLVLPTWNHLWFVAYLWVYSMILALAACLPLSVRTGLQRGFDWLFGGWRLVALPVAWAFATKAVLAPIYGETHALLDDPYAHGLYGFAFAFGYALAKSASAWAMIDRHWKALLCLAVGSGAVMFGLHRADLGTMAAELVEIGARSILAWTAILGLLGLARARLHYDGPARRYLSEAIFPFYIAHQTIIVLVGYGLKQMQVGPVVEFTGILFATAMGCLATFEIARRVHFMRPLLGLKVAATPALIFGNLRNIPALPVSLRAFLLGLGGIAILPAVMELPAGAPIAAVLMGPLVLLALASVVGAWAAPRVGLNSLLALGSKVSAKAMVAWFAGAIALGLLVAFADHASAWLWNTPGIDTLREGRGLTELMLGILYGGLTEEVLLRWGLMSVLVLGLLKALPRRTALWLAAILTALAFALSHLPSAAVEAGGLTSALFARTLIWNGLLGLAFAAAFIRNGLEAAMLAHIGVHLGFALAAL